MIISRRQNFIFAAIPKTGTHAVRRALRAHLGPDDEEQVGMFEHRRLSIPALAQLNHGHLTLNDIRPHLPAPEFDAALKFAFVRNPFDRFISYCAFRTREHGAFLADPQAVMGHFLFRAPPERDLWFAPQYIFVTAPDGSMLADDIGRVEAMQSSYDRIADRIGIPTSPLDTVNATKRGDYRDYYTPPLVDAVKRRYERDLTLFGYDFDG
jgi:hypothetical protein